MRAFQCNSPKHRIQVCKQQFWKLVLGGCLLKFPEDSVQDIQPPWTRRQISAVLTLTRVFSADFACLPSSTLLKLQQFIVGANLSGMQWPIRLGVGGISRPVKQSRLPCTSDLPNKPEISHFWSERSLMHFPIET